MSLLNQLLAVYVEDVQISFFPLLYRERRVHCESKPTGNYIICVRST